MEELVLGLREKFLESGFELGLLPDGKTFVFRPCFWVEVRAEEVSTFQQAVGTNDFSYLLFKYLVSSYVTKLESKIKTGLWRLANGMRRVKEANE